MDAMSDLSALNLEAGSLVGGYTLISRLGSGAMGSVWRVRDDGGHQYAMKILRDSLAEEDASGERSRDQLTARERLRREAMALQKVRHPGVCGIVDMELDDALAFIVTELIDGKNLREDVRANGRYVGDDLERLGRKLIEAVKAVHAAGIVHRDIKPTNVMVSNTGPVLVDFGIAMGEGESHVTRTGLVMGTPGFIAPEIIDGAESDEMSDWWSVASVLAFAATGEPVFGTKPMMAVLERAAAGSANLVGLPAGTMAAFRSALNPDRTKRCTPDELLQAIALDALNPQAWDAADTASDSGSTAGISEAMPPFAESPDNPRELWRALDHITGEDAIGTRTLPQFVEATQTIGTTGIADITDTVIADASDAGTSVMNINAHTTTIPLGTGTRVMPVQDAWNPTQEATQIDPAIKPALQRIANQRPPAVIPNASVEKAQNVHAQDIPTSTMPVMPATPITQASPAAPLNLNASDSLFARLTAAPGSIRADINETTRRKKAGFLRREITEAQAVLAASGRADKFPMVCFTSLLCFALGACIAIAAGNAFLVPVLAVGLMLTPFWYVKLTAGSFKKDVAAELETALSVITTAYLRNENFQQAVEENVRYLHPPVQ